MALRFHLLSPKCSVMYWEEKNRHPSKDRIPRHLPFLQQLKANSQYFFSMYSDLQRAIKESCLHLFLLKP
ncbi:hypothetical protein E2320_018845, partial [Naja naja]